MTMGADPIACAALAGGADVKAFFVRKEAKAHGLARRIEGPLLDAGDRCMLVEDVVTTGGSTLRALEAVRDEGHEVCGVLAICDRLAGGAEAIQEAAGVPYVALTTIDDVYPERPDRYLLAPPGRFRRASDASQRPTREGWGGGQNSNALQGVLVDVACYRGNISERSRRQRLATAASASRPPRKAAPLLSPQLTFPTHNREPPPKAPPNR